MFINSDIRCAACLAFSRGGERGTVLSGVKSKPVSKSREAPVGR